jgi:hypothetical protein
MWQCPKCELQLSGAPPPPIRCGCGFVDLSPQYADGDTPKAAARVISNYRPRIPESHKEARLELCRDCEHMPCLGCGHERLTGYLDTKCPNGKWAPPACDVLYIRQPGLTDKWAWHGRHMTTLADAAGIALIYCHLLPFEDEVERIETLRPRLVINSALAMTAENIRTLSDRFPETVFVTINHSAESHLATHPTLQPKYLDHLRLAENNPNCWIGNPDPRNTMGLLLDRHVWIPNVVIQKMNGVRRLGNPPTLSLIARHDPVKNLPGQLMAAAIASKRLPLRLRVAVRNGDPDIIRGWLERGRVEVEILEWVRWVSHLTRLDSTDVGLQVSFCESFNYCALDHCMRGVPVVGSQAIQFLPESWKADPTDPADIAARVLAIIEDYPAQSAVAIQTANAVAEHNNAAFVRVLQELLS